MRQCPYTNIFEEKGEWKRRVEPGSFGLPTEHLTTGPSQLTEKIIKKIVSQYNVHFMYCQCVHHITAMCERYRGINVFMFVAVEADIIVITIK